MSDNPSQRIDVSESFVHPAAYAARLALPIFLIGYRCTGKTTVAQLLAQTLGWNWLDADAVLEERQGCRIAQIFANSGEAAFRDIEAMVLGELCERNRYVIATGG